MYNGVRFHPVLVHLFQPPITAEYLLNLLFDQNSLLPQTILQNYSICNQVNTVYHFLILTFSTQL